MFKIDWNPSAKNKFTVTYRYNLADRTAAATSGNTAIAFGNSIFFYQLIPIVEGLITNDIASSQIDIYDVATNTWTIATLSEARAGITAITTGNKLIFAGGHKKVGPIDDPYDPSKKVDIYDASANSWSTGELPQPGYWGSAAALNNKVVFNFYNTPSSVNIYDVATNGWSTVPLSESRYNPLVRAAGNKILIAGGRGAGGAASYSNRVDI